MAKTAQRKSTNPFTPSLYNVVLIVLIAVFLILMGVIYFRWSQFRAFSESIINRITYTINPHLFTMYKMDRPFLNIYDQNDRMLNIAFITHHFTRDDCINNYNKAVRSGIKFIGMSSYCEFPARISNPHDILNDLNNIAYTYNYYTLTVGWCHCFREPEKYLTPPTPTYPLALISESDFANYEKHTPDTNNTPAEYDFMYVCLKDNDQCTDGWQSYNRNWTTAKKLLDIMCKDYGLKGLLIGRIGCEVPTACKHITELTDFQEYNTFIANYKKVKFLFFPNIADASPRVMTEGMCYNLPILCNYDILGGWKYITPETGELFTENDFADKLKLFLDNMKAKKYKPREFIINNYGKVNAGKRLLEFVKKCVPTDQWNLNPNEIEYLKPGI